MALHAASRQLRQPLGGARAQQVHDGRDDLAVVRQPAVLLGHEPVLRTGQHGEPQGHSSVALPFERVVELAPVQPGLRDRLLPHPDDVQAAIVGRGPALPRCRCRVEQAAIGTQIVVGPRGRIEQVRRAAQRRVGQQLVQGRQRTKHDAGQVLGVVTQVECRELAHRGIDRAQREYRRE